MCLVITEFEYMRFHQIQGYIQNIFLAEYDHGCILLDGACLADFVKITAFFRDELKRPLIDLKAVVVTHIHPDHAGCAHKLRKASGCKIYTGRFTKQWYQGLTGYFAYLIDIWLAYWVAKRLGKAKKSLFYPRYLDADAQLDDKQTIPEFPEWSVISTPGHTDRDISVVNDKREIIYVADLVVFVKGKFTSPFPVYLPQQYKNSINKLHDYLGYNLCMAHVVTTSLTQDHIDEIMQNAPNTPQTNLNYVKQKIKRIKELKRRM